MSVECDGYTWEQYRDEDEKLGMIKVLRLSICIPKIGLVQQTLIIRPLNVVRLSSQSGQA
eukprot:911467-Amorphochlora_amoeboformis.AAC.2